jgi:hypothetical protein
VNIQDGAKQCEFQWEFSVHIVLYLLKHDKPIFDGSRGSICGLNAHILPVVFSLISVIGSKFPFVTANSLR